MSLQRNKFRHNYEHLAEALLCPSEAFGEGGAKADDIHFDFDKIINSLYSI